MKGNLFISLRKCRILHAMLLSIFTITCIFNGQFNLVSANENQSVPIKEVSFESSQPNYSPGGTDEDGHPNLPEGGSWKIDKSAEWTGQDTARVTFDVDTQRSNPGRKKDVILVFDISGSMDGKKIQCLQDDAKDLIEALNKENPGSRVAIITFSATSSIVDPFRDVDTNKEHLNYSIGSIAAGGNTNYYQPLLNVQKILDDYTDENNESHPKYEKRDDTDLVTLFLTDGEPNSDTHYEIGEYQSLKNKYPDMKINGIQYEMGNRMSKHIINISDKQWIADMTTLHNTLINAALEQQKYEKYEVVDYINLEDFKEISEKDITISHGSVKVDEPYDNKQKVTWTLDGMYTGDHETMDIDLKINDDENSKISNTNYLYKTNTEEKVTYKLEDNKYEEHTVTSTKTPILKLFYDVKNYNNNPDTTLEINDNKVTTPDPDATRTKRVFSTINREPATENKDLTPPTYDGWLFKGWQIITEHIKNLNSDYFIMPEFDVDIVGTWGKVGVTKSMEAEELSATESPTFASGKVLNVVMKRLTGQAASYNTSNQAITDFKYADSLPADADDNKIEELKYSTETQIEQDSLGNITTGKYVNVAVKENSDGSISTDKDNPIWMWFVPDMSIDEEAIQYYPYNGLRPGEIHWHADATKEAKLNPDCSYMFAYFTGISNFDTNNTENLDGSEVTTMGSMFQNALSSLVDTNTIDLTGLSLPKLSNIRYMFGYDSSAKKLILKAKNFGSEGTYTTGGGYVNGVWTTSECKGVDATTMFQQSHRTTLDLTEFDTSNITNMNSMFNNSPNLNNIIGLDKFNTENVWDMGSMFSSCSGLTSLDLTSFKTSNVTNMSSMFYKCSNLETIDLSSFDTGNVTYMTSMFYMYDKYNPSAKLKTIYVSDKFVFKTIDSNGDPIVDSWGDTVSIGSNTSNMFKDCKKLVGGQGTVYDSSKIDATYAHIDGGVDNPGYFTDIKDKPTN